MTFPEEPTSSDEMEPVELDSEDGAPTVSHELVVELGLSGVELAAWAAQLADVNESLELVIRPRRRED